MNKNSNYKREKNQVCKKSVDLLLDLFSIPPQQLCQVDLVAPPRHKKACIAPWQPVKNLLAAMMLDMEGPLPRSRTLPPCSPRWTITSLRKTRSKNSAQSVRTCYEAFFILLTAFWTQKNVIIFAGKKLDKWKVFKPLPSSPGRFWGSRCQLFRAFDEAHLVRGLAFFWHSTEK